MRRRFCLEHECSAEFESCDVGYMEEDRGIHGAPCRVVEATILWKSSEEAPCCCGHQQTRHSTGTSMCEVPDCDCERFEVAF